MFVSRPGTTNTAEFKMQFKISNSRGRTSTKLMWLAMSCAIVHRNTSADAEREWDPMRLTEHHRPLIFSRVKRYALTSIWFVEIWVFLLYIFFLYVHYFYMQYIHDWSPKYHSALFHIIELNLGFKWLYWHLRSFLRVQHWKNEKGEKKKRTPMELSAQFNTNTEIN